MTQTLNPQDTFSFHCRACGACCRDDREILLNPQDVFNLSRHFSLDTSEFIQNFCSAEPDAGYRGFPILMLLTPGGDCVFLDHDRCSVHTVRPACCRNYPVGTLFDQNGEARHVLMEPVPGCLGFHDGQSFTLDTWTRAAGLDGLAPDIELIRTAFSLAMQYSPDKHKRQRLFNILYDFDPLPAPDESSLADVQPSSAAAMQILKQRLISLFAV